MNKLTFIEACILSELALHGRIGHKAGLVTAVAEDLYGDDTHASLKLALREVDKALPRLLEDGYIYQTANGTGAYCLSGRGEVAWAEIDFLARFPEPKEIA